MKIISKIIVGVFVLISCAMCSAGSDNNTPSVVSPITITESSSIISLAQGDQYQLQVYDIANNNITESATWVSSDSNIVSVVNGTVKIESNQGSATIYAQYNNATSNSIKFNSGRVMFATEALHNGNLINEAKIKSNDPSINNGIVAADYLCNNDNNKPEFGTFKALIITTQESNNLFNVIDTSKTINYINKDGSLIGNSQSTSGNPIIQFTGSFVDNTRSYNIFNWNGSSLNTCSDWTTSESDKEGGVGHGNSNSWYNNDNPPLYSIWRYVNEYCDAYQSLICVQKAQQ